LPASQQPVDDKAPGREVLPYAEGSRPVPDAWSEWQRERLSGVEAAFAGSTIRDRPEVLQALNAAVRDAIARGGASAVLLFDLNNFAEINSAWGPSGGDEVLAAAGARIEAYAGEHLGRIAPGGAIVGRLDADHFAVIVPEVASLEGLRRVAAEMVRELARPFNLAGRAMSLSARAAIVQIPIHGRSVTTVLGRGFRLLNTVARAKADGVVLSQEEWTEGASTVSLERDLVAALNTDQLFIALQPKVETTTGLVQGAEALVRWLHPERGLLPPPMFIETAEKSGLIFDLGLRILQDACQAGNRLAAKGRDLTVAVNVSPHQLAHPDFLSRFLEVIDREGTPPQMLEIEVTETAAMMGGERVLESLQSLRRCGMGVAIDDFGTGFSNLASLAALPADTLKIDRSLVIGGDHGGKAGALLDIAVQLGKTFGMATVAEGVETTHQMKNVTDLGCDLVQGYFTGRPVRATEFAGCYLQS
jgi:predicted signal transduction protein with EAL and GGDEF domain